MIGSPHVDDPLEATRHELVVVIGNVGGKIAGDSIGAHQHFVFVSAHISGREPDGAIPLGHHAGVSQHLHDRVKGVILVQRALREPVVVLDADHLEICAQPIYGALQGNLAHGIDRLCTRHIQEFSAKLIHELLAHLDHVLPMVAGLRHFLIFAKGLRVAHVGCRRKILELRAPVVDVVLSEHVIAGGFQHAGEGVAQHSVAGRTDVQWAGGVHADKFDLRALPLAHIQLAIVLAGSQDRLDLAHQPLLVEGQIDETGGRGVCAGQHVGGRQMAQNHAGDLHGGLAGQFRRLHGNRRGKIAKFDLLGMIEHDLRQLIFREVTGGLCARDGFCDDAS